MKTLHRINAWLVATPWTDLGCCIALSSVCTALGDTHPIQASVCLVSAVIVFCAAPRK